MHFPRSPRGPRRLTGWCFLASTSVLAQTVDHTVIGLTDLNNRYGVNAPDGRSVTVWQTEALEGANFAPNPTGLSQTFLYFPSPPGTIGGISSHATSVMADFYGPGGVSKAVPFVYVQSANDFIYPPHLINPAAPAVTSPLNVLGAALPSIPSRSSGGSPVPLPQVMNASWAGGIDPVANPFVLADVPSDSATTSPVIYSAAAFNNDVNRRMDYLVQTAGLTAVVGVNNSATTPAANLASSYNTLAVGLSNGSAAQGYSGTATEGVGRMVVDLVAPAPVSSFAAPAVAGAATLLVDQANRTPSLADAQNPMVVRSLLMTGAQKLPGWQHGDAGSGDDVIHPLDKIQGAGELRINRSYDLLMAGEKAPGSLSLEQGWSLASVASGGVRYYFLDNNIAHGTFAATLNWNRTSDGTIQPVSYLLQADLLADLNLELLASDSGDNIGSSLALSASTVDNVEHIYIPDLPVGRYVLAVEAGAAATDAAAFGLSFQVIPEMPMATPILGLAGLAGVWKWRRSRRA